MKITILSKQPINTISGMEQFQKKLAQEGSVEITCQQYLSGGQRDVIAEIMSSQHDLLITVDLPGFEQCTLTDNIAYNLLTCKQLHLLLHQQLPNEPYLDRPLNFAMFFYCVGEEYYDHLQKQYPDLPYLKVLAGWQLEEAVRAEEGNAEALYEVYQEVLRESLLQA